MYSEYQVFSIHVLIFSNSAAYETASTAVPPSRSASQALIVSLSFSIPTLIHLACTSYLVGISNDR